ncbi:MAG: diguanylate cyclase [Acidobacteriota bacterium]
MDAAPHASVALVRALALFFAGLSATLFSWLALKPADSISEALALGLGTAFCLSFLIVALAVSRGLSQERAGGLATAALLLLSLTGSTLHGGVDSPILVLGVVAPTMALVLHSGAAAAAAFVLQTLGVLALLLVGTSGASLPWDRALTLIVATSLAWLLADRLWRQSAGLAAELEFRDRTDPLTGVANRRRFFEALRGGTDEESARSEPATSVVLFEVDSFHELRERYGNRTADRSMMDVAQLLAGCLRRETDTVARLSSGEFGAVLRATRVEDAHRLAERAVELVRTVGIPHEGTESRVLTLSAGVAAVDDESPDQSVRRARESLTAARTAGGDRAFSPPSGTLAFPQLGNDEAETDVES